MATYAREDDPSQTHIERLNPGGNPADGTGAAPGADPGAPPKPDDSSKFGPLRTYRLLANAFVGSIFRKAGEIVELYDHQVGAHHEPFEHEGPLSAQGLPIQPPAPPPELAPLLRAGDRVLAPADQSADALNAAEAAADRLAELRAIVGTRQMTPDEQDELRRLEVDWR